MTHRKFRVLLLLHTENFVYFSLTDHTTLRLPALSDTGCSVCCVYVVQGVASLVSFIFISFCHLSFTYNLSILEPSNGSVRSAILNISSGLESANLGNWKQILSIMYFGFVCKFEQYPAVTPTVSRTYGQRSCVTSFASRQKFVLYECLLCVDWCVMEQLSSGSCHVRVWKEDTL